MPGGSPRILGNTTSQRMCSPAGDEAPAAPVAPLAVNYSPECCSKPVTSGNCAATEQSAWDNTYSLFVTFTSRFHLAQTLLMKMCHKKRSASLRQAVILKKKPPKSLIKGFWRLSCALQGSCPQLQLWVGTEPFDTCRESVPVACPLPLVTQRFIRTSAQKPRFLSPRDKLKSLLKPE